MGWREPQEDGTASPMNEADTTLGHGDPDAYSEPDAVQASEEHLATTRMAAIGPLPPVRSPSRSSGPVGDRDSAEPAPIETRSLASPRTSWWRALLASTLPPPAPAAPTALAPIDDRVARQGIAAAAAALGLIVILVALVVGLRGASAALLVSPNVAVALILARAFLAMALMGLGLAFLRAAERVYFR